jgi:hypothetical protein
LGAAGAPVAPIRVEQEVPVCGCGEGSAPTRARPIDASIATDRGRTIPLRYRGARALLIPGPATGVGYVCHPGEVIAVLERDAERLVAAGVFSPAK